MIRAWGDREGLLPHNSCHARIFYEWVINWSSGGQSGYKKAPHCSLACYARNADPGRTNFFMTHSIRSARVWERERGGEIASMTSPLTGRALATAGISSSALVRADLGARIHKSWISHRILGHSALHVACKKYFTSYNSKDTVKINKKATG